MNYNTYSSYYSQFTKSESTSVKLGITLSINVGKKIVDIKSVDTLFANFDIKCEQIIIRNIYGRVNFNFLFYVSFLYVYNVC